EALQGTVADYAPHERSSTVAVVVWTKKGEDIAGISRLRRSPTDLRRYKAALAKSGVYRRGFGLDGSYLTLIVTRRLPACGDYEALLEEASRETSAREVAIEVPGEEDAWDSE